MESFIGLEVIGEELGPGPFAFGVDEFWSDVSSLSFGRSTNFWLRVVAMMLTTCGS